MASSRLVFTFSAFLFLLHSLSHAQPVSESRRRCVLQAPPTGVESLSISDASSLYETVPVSIKDRLRIVHMAIVLLRDINPHRFMHLNFLKIDPVMRLKYLSKRLKTQKGRRQTNRQFHEEMIDIYMAMNDFHTLYVLPPPFRSMACALGFNTAIYYVPGELDMRGEPKRRYVVTRNNLFKFSLGDPDFERGVEILKYDGVNIDDEVLRLGKSSYAANLGARLEEGRRALIFRGLGTQMLPGKDRVVVTYRTLNGKVKTLLVCWTCLRVSTPPVTETPEPSADEDESTPMGSMLTLETIIDKEVAGDNLYMKRVRPIELREDFIPTVDRVSGNRTTIEVFGNFTRFFEAEIIPTTRGPIGRLLINSFTFGTGKETIAELRRILGRMPTNGLILDIRGNPGGDPNTGKLLLDMVSDKNIIRYMNPSNLKVSTLFKKLLKDGNSRNLTGDDCEPFIKRFLFTYQPSFETAFKAGESFSSAGPFLTTSVVERRFRQVYRGPIITVMDANSYSASDIFAANVVDSGASKLVGLADTTGAGGASTTTAATFRRCFPKLFDELPAEIIISTSFVRYYRSGEKAGSIVEGFGVKPDIRYYNTRDDVLMDSCDLYEFLAKELRTS